MDTLQIHLSEEQRAFVDEQITQEGHASAGDYLLSLVDQAKTKRAWEKAEKLVLEGLQTPARPFTPEDWQRLHARVGKNTSRDSVK